MKKILILTVALMGQLFTSASAFADTVAPVLKEGDKWIYSVTEAKNTNGLMSSSTKQWEYSVTRAGSHSFTLAVKTSDSNMPAKELSRNSDWSVSASINGESTVTSKPFDFPLKDNKTWKVEYTNNNPDAKVKSEKISKQYTVLGWDDITVPAGKFHALKIEMEGTWRKDFSPVGPSAVSAVTSDRSGSTGVVKTQNAGTPGPASGKLYQVFWYVPEIKAYVKAIFEDYQSGGTLNKRITEELGSFNPAAQ